MMPLNPNVPVRLSGQCKALRHRYAESARRCDCGLYLSPWEVGPLGSHEDTRDLLAEEEC